MGDAVLAAVFLLLCAAIRLSGESTFFSIVISEVHIIHVYNLPAV